MKRILLKVETIFLRVGAVLGVVAIVILLNSEMFRPGPPDMEVYFTLSRSAEINYAYQGSDPAPDYTEAFPLVLVIHNSGGTLAKNVSLSLFPGYAQKCRFKVPNPQIEGWGEN